MRALLAAAGLALLAGCAAPGDDEAVVPAAGSHSGAVPVVEVPQPGSSGQSADPLGASCTGPAGLRVEHPAGWAVNPGTTVPGCTMFSPEPFTVPPHSDARVAAVVLKVSDLTLDELAAATPDEVRRTGEVVDGHRAVRVQIVSGPGLWPEGTPVTRWVVDLGDRTLVADAVGLPHFDHEGDVEALDAMMRALEIDATV